MHKIEVKLECILENQNEDRNLLRQMVASLLPTGASADCDVLPKPVQTLDELKRLLETPDNRTKLVHNAVTHSQQRTTPQCCFCQNFLPDIG